LFLVLFRCQGKWELIVPLGVWTDDIDGDEMPRYYFHVRSHASFDLNTEGSEFPTLDDAHDEAIQAAREILVEKVLAADVIDGQHFEITAEDSTVLRDVPFRSALRLE